MNFSLLDYYSVMKLPSLVNFLNTSSFDDLIELNIADNTFRFVYNVDEKYNPPLLSGSIDDFCQYCAKHDVYSEDSALYLSMMDTSTMLNRLEKSETPGALSFRFRIKRPDGQLAWVEQLLVGTARHGLPEGIVYCYIFDIQHLKNREAGINLVNNRPFERDRLTGLLLRENFFSAAENELKSGTMQTMVVLDMENFKMFNDWYGRKTGDRVLAAIGQYFEDCAQSSGGIAGYLGQDDFCLLFPNQVLSVSDLYANIHKVILRFGVSVGFLPSLGYAVSEPGVSMLDLYDRAALACQQAKGNFKRRIQIFDNTMYRQSTEDYHILSEFQQALAAGEITFFLQPQCRASTGKIVGAESLARWRKADGTYVSPVAFIPPLEKHGFIADLDMYIWDKVCAWMRKSIDKGLPMIPVSVNVSQVDVFTMDVPQYLTKLIEQYDLPKTSLKIEITESACGEDSNQVRTVVQELRRLGFTVLMDDFGSGYSSLNVLHEMSFDVIKLDAKFLHLNKASAEKGMHILESVVSMAKTLGIPIIVEGVETQDQKEYLTSLGCRYVQGYFFYRPMPLDEFEKLIGDPNNVDTAGFVAKTNEQFRVREFLDDAVYSDAMLNNILGPVAIYSLHDNDVDIIRYNQQFYEAVAVKDFDERQNAIQKVMPKKDADLLYKLLNEAIDNRLNGASGVMNFFRSDGGVSRFLIHFYFLSEIDGCKQFYGSARDVTEITNLNNHMQLLQHYFSGTIIFLMRSNRGFRFKIAAHGLDHLMQISYDQLEKELDSGEFFLRVIEEEQPKLNKFTHEAITLGKPFVTEFHFNAPGGRVLDLIIKCDLVDDPTNDVQAIISIGRMHRE